ncbi:TPA: DNA-binding protein, partial [Salmonella enterica subsp. enterica serovar Enteritidis]|nr:DNA-binding protein [Salmonella enterica subsp. enterica serovar Enteritidis]HAF0680105.1 DNA-binding protein [Salmonella enterica subsp. enterica serovar Enteritidis]
MTFTFLHSIKTDITKIIRGNNMNTPDADLLHLF